MLDVRHFSPEMLSKLRDRADELLLPKLSRAAKLFADWGVRAVANEWLLKQDWKRAVAVQLLGDLLSDGAPRRRIVEIGGGLSALTIALAEQHDYRLFELASHENGADYREVERRMGRRFVRLGDWYEQAPQSADIVIANDLFPNVDQRLYEFFERFRPISPEFRLSLTYYECTAWRVRREGSGETLTVCPWGLRQVTRLLEHLEAEDPDSFGQFDRRELVYRDYGGALFGNKRNILLFRAWADKRLKVESEVTAR